ncbi:MAG: hypothetical protein NTX38_14260 [Methylobacter sp.]|nr:hypothetical protein [Methylobacter sp.]
MDSITTEQFKNDLSQVIFSTTKPIPHDHRLLFYGGICAVPEHLKPSAFDIATQHRKDNATHALTEQDAANEVKQECKDPSRVSFQGFLKQVIRHGGDIPQEVRQRLIAAVGDDTPVKSTPKPQLDELAAIAIEKAQTTYDLDCMSGKDANEVWGRSRREELYSMYDHCLGMAEYVSPLTKKKGGDTLAKHYYIKKKGLQDCTEALEACNAFVDSGNIIVPFQSAYHLENKWRDAWKNPVEMSAKELAVRNCSSYQKIPSGDGPKLFCTGTKTSGLFNQLGNIQDASLVLALEGFASGMTAYQATKTPTICVGSCDNFLPAVASLLENDVCNRILMIGDSGTEDKLKKVHAAIEAYSFDWGRRVAWSTVPGPDNYDINDMMNDSGIEAVVC